LSIIAIIASVLTTAQTGCRSKATQDLYRQRMAGEIRVLEDKLHDAEYQNRVLSDRMERDSTAAAAPSTPKPSTPDETPRPDPLADLPSVVEGESGDEFDPDEFALPMIDEGAQVDPESLMAPQGVPQDQEETDKKDKQLLPAPGGPEPPGRNDTEAPQIIPGEPGPPGALDEELKPPGQVLVPDSVPSAAGVPEKLRIHPGLSRGQQLDGQGNGLMIVLNAVDKFGRMVSLDGFDVNADMTIVVLDPQLEPSRSRIGRWEFSSPQVATFLRTHPVSGLHVPIEWGDALPSGDEVIVHVRLRAEGDEMRCEARVYVDQQAAVAEWTPRGSSRQ
jgi:hypothetical protein